MIDSPFDPGGPFDDPGEPFTDPLDPFADAADPFGGVFPQSPTPFDPVPSPSPDPVAGPIEEIVTPGTEAPDLFPKLPELPEPTAWMPELDNQAFEPIPVETEQLGSLENVIPSEPLQIQEREPELEKVLDQLEASIEGTTERPVVPSSELPSQDSDVPQKPVENGIGSELEQEAKASEVHSAQRVYGVRSPDPKIDFKPERTYEKLPPIKLWRPRRPSGVRGSSLSRGTKERPEKSKARDRAKVRDCPAKGEIVSIAECESCEHSKDSECRWQPEDDAEASGQKQDGDGTGEN